MLKEFVTILPPEPLRAHSETRFPVMTTGYPSPSEISKKSESIQTAGAASENSRGVMAHCCAAPPSTLIVGGLPHKCAMSGEIEFTSGSKSIFGATRAEPGTPLSVWPLLLMLPVRSLVRFGKNPVMDLALKNLVTGGTQMFSAL